jgi:ribosomal protein S27AE
MNRTDVSRPLEVACPKCGAVCRFDVGDKFICGTCGARFTVDDLIASMPVQWSPSRDGYVESRCGRWRIRPLFSGHVKPAWFELLHDGVVVERNIATQRDAKARAAHHALHRTSPPAKEG